MIARCTLLFVGILSLIIIASGYVPKCPVINTKYGTVVGSTELSRGNRSYMSFKGIPYAKPPIGDLRFKAPEPPEHWQFAINGTKDGPVCIQKNYFFADAKIEGKEDCLYLNIYVPDTSESSLLPVMVFIHWGGFFAGRGTSDYLGPEYFMDKDVILVTFNYRLGVFGFFSTLDDSAPGNFGLKDQVLALKFVQENIEYFGGDKNRVTLFGQSAGSGSTSLHLVSPSSTGLFQQAISQSGTAFNLWARPGNAFVPNVNKYLAVIVGCQEHLISNENLVECLKKLDSYVLAEAADKFKTFSIEPLTPYPVVAEIKTPANPNPFITKDPVLYFMANEFKKVPYIVGTVQDEGILRASALLRQHNTLEQLNANFTKLITNLLLLQISAGAEVESFAQNITNFYLGGNSYINISDPNSVQGFINLYSDRAFVYGTYQAITLQSLKKHKPIWVYNFNYKGQKTYGDYFAATSENIDFNWGVSHCDDLLYLFKSPALFKNLEKNDLKMSNALVTLWTNFAITGNPDFDGTYSWMPVELRDVNDLKTFSLNFLNITGSTSSTDIKFKLQKGFFEDRLKFWRDANILENFKMVGSSATNTDSAAPTSHSRSVRHATTMADSRPTASCAPAPNKNFIPSNV